MSKEEQKDKQVKKKPRKGGVWLKTIRVIWIPIVCLAALIGGLTIGYVYIGGQDLADVFKWETWKHVYDLVFAESE